MLLVTEHHPSKSISSSTNKTTGDTQHKGTTNTDIGTILRTSVISSKSAPRLILPPLSRAHEQLRGRQQVKKCPTFYGTRRTVTVLTNTHCLSLSWSRWLQFMIYHPTSLWFILILFSYMCLGIPSSVFLSGFPTLQAFLFCPIHATYPAHLITLDLIIQLCIWCAVHITKLLIMQHSPASNYFVPHSLRDNLRQPI